MKIYLDLVMMMNFFLDFLLLLSVSIILKRNANIKKIILSSFIGGLSILILFIKMSNLELILFKFITSVIMVLIGFGYQNIQYTLINILYLYIVSIFLGGFLYFLNDQFCVQRKGLVFINNGFSITFVVIVIISPIIIYLYTKQSKMLKDNYNNYYSLSIYYNDKCLELVGFLDTGNSLKFLKKDVILLDKRKFIFDVENYLFIPYETIDNTSLLKAFKPDLVIINEKRIKNVLVGIIDRVSIDGADVILNNNIKEKIC